MSVRATCGTCETRETIGSAFLFAEWIAEHNGHEVSVVDRDTGDRLIPAGGDDE